MSASGAAAASFGYPFRAGWRHVWAVGVPLAFVCPLGIVPLLGYAIAATRAILAGELAPPPWRASARLLRDGALLLCLLLLVTVPFALAIDLGSERIAPAFPVAGSVVRRAYAVLAVGLPLAVAWAFVMLVLVPSGVARYARSGRPADLFDAPAALRTLRRRFWTWNVAGVPIVTAWAIAVLAVPAGLLGAPFAAFYAILVSAHASSTLAETAG